VGAIYIIWCERARWIGPLRLRNVRCYCLCTTNVYPRTPIMICGCIYTIRHETGAMNRPLRLRNVCCNCLCTINVYTTNT